MTRVVIVFLAVWIFHGPYSAVPELSSVTFYI